VYECNGSIGIDDALHVFGMRLSLVIIVTVTVTVTIIGSLVIVQVTTTVTTGIANSGSGGGINSAVYHGSMLNIQMVERLI
jgi:hypothetical protein